MELLQKKLSHTLHTGNCDTYIRAFVCDILNTTYTQETFIKDSDAEFQQKSASSIIYACSMLKYLTTLLCVTRIEKVKTYSLSINDL